MPAHFSLWRVFSILSVMLLACITLRAQAAPQVTAKTASTLPPYLSNLTLSSTDIIGGSGATGTVTLSSPAPARGITVALHSNNSAATAPATCTIAAGATQATFRIKTAAVSAGTTATLSGAYNGWAQGEWLSVLPSNPPLIASPGVPLIHVAPGNGCAVVSWNRLEEGTVSGYNVYCTSGGTTTLLTPKPFKSNFYLDTGLINDTATYTYQVAAMNMQGQEQALSAPMSAVPSSATAALNWISPPSAVTDRLTASVALSSGEQIFGALLLIDGVQAGGGGETFPVNGVQTHTAGAGYDSTKLSNGPYTVQFLGFMDSDETVSGVAPPITIQVSNTISNDSIIGGWFDPTQGELCYLSATVPAGSTWIVQVTRQDSAIVLRTWQGASSLVKLAWDGKDAAGKPMPLTDYSLQLTVQPPGTPPITASAAAVVKKNHPVSLIYDEPIAPALVSMGTGQSK